MRLKMMSCFSSIRQLLIGLIVGTIFTLSALPNAQAQLVSLPDFTPIVKKADPAVVNIRTMATIPVRTRGPNSGDPYELFRWFFGPDFQYPNSREGSPIPVPRTQPAPEKRTVPRGLGSGFFISADGEILTNNHVVSDATDIYVTLTDGREFKAKVIGTDERTDVALIKIDAKNMTALPIGDPKKLEKGNWVMAIGSPFGLDSSVTAGIVSAIGRDTGDYLPFIQTDVAVNPGNSGGPLLNLHGEVVGINSQIISRSGGFMGISLAIPIDEAMRVANQLRSTGKVTRGLIGVGIGEVTKDVASAIGLPKAQGALISSVNVDSPAEAAGLQPGDVVLTFNHSALNRWSDLPRLVGDTKPGTRIPLEIWRKGKKLTVIVKIGELPRDHVKPSVEGGKDTQIDALGLSIAEISTEMQHKLRIKGGVLVRASSGPAEAVGIAAGDFILAINDEDVSNVESFHKLVKHLDKTKTTGLLVRRGAHTQWVAIQPLK